MSSEKLRKDIEALSEATGNHEIFPILRAAIRHAENVERLLPRCP